MTADHYKQKEIPFGGTDEADPSAGADDTLGGNSRHGLP